MNEFVEECRREWKRLRVPDPVANEMAADLQADLDEAEADGSSPEEVLGTGAFDARAFAASWAAERGVAPPPGQTQDQPSRAPRPRWRLGVLAALAVVGVVALVAVAGVALAVHPFGSSAQAAIAFPGPGPRLVTPAGPHLRAPLQAHGAALRVLIVAVGSVVLLGAFLLGATLALLCTSWVGSGRWPAARRDRDTTTHGR